MADAIEAMVRQGISLRQASTQLQITLTTQDCENIQRRRSFQKLLGSARLRYYAELGTDPEFTKESVVGFLFLAMHKLYEQGDFDKAGEIALKIQKIKGEVGSETNVNVFAELSQKDLHAIRKRLEEGKAPRIPDVN